MSISYQNVWTWNIPLFSQSTVYICSLQSAIKIYSLFMKPIKQKQTYFVFRLISTIIQDIICYNQYVQLFIII